MIALFKARSRWLVIGIAAAVVLALATLAGAQTENPAATKQSAPRQSAVTSSSGENIDQKVTAIVRDWENLPGVFDDIETYSQQIRELVRIGKPAVPALCAALDHTDRDVTMRLMGFTLRAIGDPRAVPALIRAIPKTLLPPGSDCGMSVKDPGLSAFMATNDLDAAHEPWRRNGFGMGRPVREICGALVKITGTHVGEDEIYFLFLDGGEQQRAEEREAFYKVACRWADWWKANYQRFAADPALADVQLPAPAKAPTTVRFLTGENIKASEGAGGVTVAPLENGRDCCLVLNLNRILSLPAQFSMSNAASPENISAWAAKAGVDILGTRYQDPQSGQSYYSLRGVGLQAWEIPNKCWSTIEKDIQRGALPALDTPAGDLLMHFDAESDRYAPQRKATFLFITRDGSQGILRITGQVTRHMTERDYGIPYFAPDENDPNQTSDAGPEFGVKLDYRFFYEETAQIKAETKAREDAVKARTRARQENAIAKLLAKYPQVTGTVFSPDGQVVSNASVLVAANGESVVVSDGRLQLGEFAPVVSTLADGSFKIPLVPGGRAYVAHESGFCQVDLAGAKSPLAIHLTPWGRIEGTITLEGKLAPHQKMGLLDASDFRSPSEPHLSVSYYTESDDQGRFIFDRVPPGEVKVCRLVASTFCDEQMVNVAAGKTTVFRHGFDGRMVKGHLVASDYSKIQDWHNGLNLQFSTKSTVPAAPENEDPSVWATRYWLSAEGKKALRASHHFGTSVEPNGDFQVEDVPPGTYELTVDLHEGGGNGPFFTGKTLGQLKRDVEVPKEQKGQSTDPFDLGNLVMQMSVTLKPQDSAPDFAVKTVNGQPLRLADFRGKYVLLDFWATWCGPCRGETPNLKAVYDAYGTNANFAMVSLSLDKTPSAPASYCQTNGMQWIQGYLGDWSKASLPGQYGVEGIPAIFLLDPNGKIVATDLRGDNIMTAVRAALGNR